MIDKRYQKVVLRIGSTTFIIFNYISSVIFGMMIIDGFK